MPRVSPERRKLIAENYQDYRHRFATDLLADLADAEQRAVDERENALKWLNKVLAQAEQWETAREAVIALQERVDFALEHLGNVQVTLATGSGWESKTLREWLNSLCGV